MTPTLRVALIEDDALYRRSLERLLTRAPDYSVAASFGDARAAIREVERAVELGTEPQWDVVLTDIQMPGMTGIEATGRIKVLVPELPVVVLTVFDDPTTVLQAIRAGADGYLVKKTPPEEMLELLRAIVGGGSPLTPSVAKRVLELLRAPSTLPRASSEDARARFDLSEREIAVLRCLSQGLAYKQVASALGISLDTVRTHIRAVYRKLHVHSVSEAVGRAIREDLV